MAIQAYAIRYLKLAAVVLSGVALVYFAFRINSLAHIFYGHPGELLTQETIAAEYSAAASGSRQAVVPRIIHQIYHDWIHHSNTTLPSDWAETRQTCLDLHHDWQFLLWTDSKSHDFIETEYPWFLKTYDSFTFPIQKTDALRYFLMRHYGGIYIDLDNGCAASLEPLRYYSAWVTDGGHGALSNNILGAVPNHPFWNLVTDSLISYAWDYPLPFLTVVYATGQWFETVMWNEYHQRLTNNTPPLLRVSMDSREGAPAWVFFTHTRGGTWDRWDSHVINWVGQHSLLVLSIAAVVTLCVMAVFAPMARRWSQHRRRKYTQYAQVPST